MSNLSTQIGNLSSEKDKLFKQLLQKKGINTREKQIIPRRTKTGASQLSFAQKRLWFLDRLEPSSSSYNIPGAARLSGRLNVAILEQSLNKIISRHEVLRTNFATQNGQPVQVIAETLHLTLPVLDLQELPATEREIATQQLATQEAQRPFNLATDTLVRVRLLKLAQTEHVLLLCIHHIITDGWSMGILLRELAIVYSALCNSLPPQLPELPIQYADFAIWQRQWLQGEVLDAQLAYWKQQLDNAPALLDLPTDRPRPPVQTFRGENQTFALSQELSEGLVSLSYQHEVTLFMTLLAAFQILLYRYLQQTDICIGTPIANRNRAEIEGLIGLFVNTLVLRTDLSGDPSFEDILLQVREMTLAAYANQDLPFEQLVEALQPERSLSYTPLFQVMFALQNMPLSCLELPGLTLSPLAVESATAKFDLSLSVKETEQGLIGSWEYNADLFDAATIERMIGHFQTLLKSIVANPQQRVTKLPLLSDIQHHQLIWEWNNTNINYPLEQCFPQLFEAQVALTPDAIAVIFEDQQLTYQQLNARANIWARYLVEQGVGAETIVALVSERNIDFLTAMLAVFKTGGAYLPLNPRHPPKRVEQILSQSQVPLVLASEFWASMIESMIARLDISPQLVYLEKLDFQNYEDKNLPIRCYPENLAYVIYTSGSTGEPKGAMLEHRGMLNHLYAMVTNLQLSASDVVAQTATQTFDISIWQFLVALLVGGQVEIVPTEIAADPSQLLSLLQRQQVSMLEIVPSLLQMILQQIELDQMELDAGTKAEVSNLRWLLITGESCPPQLCRQWLKYYPRIPMMNAYGPAECSDDVTLYPIYEPPAPEVLNLPIGRQMSNTQLYILDTQLQLVPVGVAGELYVGGVGVGRGYLYNQKLTSVAFIPSPFARSPGSRLYKTGDRACYLPDGNIEFLNRVDYQVKVRGFRIELGEIEAKLHQHPSISQSVVIVREDVPGDRRLVAYLVPKEQPALTQPTQVQSDLRHFLKQQLPDYMIPSAFVMLDALPLNANGKVDRKALPVPNLNCRELETFVAPRNPIEEIVAGIWAEVLGLEKVGIHENFFTLGGHSLLATQVMSRMRDSFHVEIPLQKLFQASTVAELSQMALSYETKPGQTEKIARVLKKINTMSNDDLKQTLEQKKTKKGDR